MTLEELIKLHEDDKSGTELIFGVDYARLLNRSDYSEIKIVKDDRCGAIAMMLLKERFSFKL